MISVLFTDDKYINKIKSKLPDLFQIAEVESSRAGKVGMEVGVLRERILIAMLMYFFGVTNVDTKIPTTETELDVKLLGKLISIKTLTSKKLSRFKLAWTVDPLVALKFKTDYLPKCDILLAQINWNNIGHIYYFPLSVQIETLDKIGRENYIKLPNAGTNTRGIEISDEALTNLSSHKDTLKMEILWTKTDMIVDTFIRWFELWN